MPIFRSRDINVQYEYFFIGGNDPFLRIRLFIYDKMILIIVATVLEKHAFPYHANTQKELPLEGGYISQKLLPQ